MTPPTGYHFAAQADGVGHLVPNRGTRAPRSCDGKRFSEQFTGYPVRVHCPSCLAKHGLGVPRR